MSKKIAALTTHKVENELDSDEEDIKPIVRPLATSNERPKSGLLSFLPPPSSSKQSQPEVSFLKKSTETTSTTTTTTTTKTTTTSSSLMPRILTKTPSSTTTVIPSKPAPSKKAVTEPVKPKPTGLLLVSYGSDESDQEEESEDQDKAQENSKTEKHKLETLENEEDSDSEDYEEEPVIEEEDRPRLSYKKLKLDDNFATSTFHNHAEPNKVEETYEPREYDVEDDPEPEFDNIDEQKLKQQMLDQEALMRLCGAGDKRKMNNIKFTEVSVTDIVGDNKAELMKQITSEYKPPSNKEYFTNSSRKSHQITYLAKVAKERDTELRAQWANEKFSKRMARQKYGF